MLTDWFPPDVKPVRVGVYEIFHPDYGNDLECFAYWDGKFWGLFMPTKQGAISERYQHNCGSHQFKTWRGLSKKP